MKKMFAKLVLSCAAVATLMAGAGQAANLVSNGDFSQFTSGAPGGGPSQILNTTAGGYANLTDWTVGNTVTNNPLQSFAYVIPTTGVGAYTAYYPGNPTIGFWSNPGAAPSGTTNAVSIDGYTQGATLSQTLTDLTVGASYQVSFDWAAIQYNTASGAYTERFDVSFGSSTQSTQTYSQATHTNSDWTHESFTFTADATSDVLQFLSYGTPGGDPPAGILTNVDVQAAVPEPSTMALLGIGAVWLVGTRLRRNRVAKTV